MSNGTLSFLTLISTGTICALKWPWSIARPRAAVALDGQRVLVLARDAHFSATFSAVMPMWQSSNGSVSAPTIMSIMRASFMRAPQRIAGASTGCGS